MTLRIEISDDAENALRKAWGPDLARAAVEALALEGYRRGKLSRYEVQRLLGFSDRWQTEEWLGLQGADVNYALDDLAADREALSRKLGPASS